MLDIDVSARRPAARLARTTTTMPEMFLRRIEASAQRRAWQQKIGGVWTPTTWGRFGTDAKAFASWLIAQGVEGGDKIVIVGGTRPEWCVADMGGQLAGAVTVGAYPTLAPAQLSYLVAHADAVVLVVEGAEEVAKLREIRREIPAVRRVLVWDAAAIPADLAADGWMQPWSEAMAVPTDETAIRSRVENVKPDDTAILVYTSGTTGPPKGAMITHKNILTVLAAGDEILPLEEDDHGMSFLPMAHVAERILAFYGRIDTGTSTSYASSIAAVLAELQEVRPTVFGSVPRIYEKAYAKIMGEVAKASPGKQKVFRWAEGVGRKVVRHWQDGTPVPPLLALQYRLAYKIFGKIRAAFGGQVRMSATGAAPIAVEILEFFWAAGIRIYEVYGMTELTVVCHANRPGAVRLGSVGKPLTFADAKLADDNEVLVRGATVFKGYYKNPEATAESVDGEGFMHTGDIGREDADGYLYIVDRKKHIIITAGGKNLTPANIEQEIQGQDPLISHVHVHGDRRPYVAALITLHPIEALEFAVNKGIAPDVAAARAMIATLSGDPLARPEGLNTVMAVVAGHSEIRGRLAAAVERANAQLARVEHVRRFFILDRELSLEEEELTPTLKRKRKEIEAKHASAFDRLYGDPGFGVAVGGGGGE